MLMIIIYSANFLLAQESLKVYHMTIFSLSYYDQNLLKQVWMHLWSYPSPNLITEIYCISCNVSYPIQPNKKSKSSYIKTKSVSPMSLVQHYLHVFMTICPKILRNISNSSNAALSYLLPIHPHDDFLSRVPTQNKNLSRITSLAVMLGVGSIRGNLFLLAT